MALEFSRGRSKGDLESQILYRYAVVKAVDLVGEAATKVSPASQSELRQIPWRRMIAMRNILVHDFHHTDNDTLWEVIQVHIPSLIAWIEIALVQHNG